MRNLSLKLDSKKNATEDILILDGETRLLLMTERYPSSATVKHTLSNLAGHSVESKVNGYIERINPEHYDYIKLEGVFNTGEGVNAELFLGSWAEIIMYDLEINLNMFYQSPVSGTMGFRIGLANMANLFVERDTAGNFMIIRTLILSPTTSSTKDDFVLSGSETAERIESIYNRIIANTGNTAFVNRQVSQAEILADRLFKFLREY
jgi:hypothetical protein